MATANVGIKNNSPQALDQRSMALSGGVSVPYDDVATAHAAQTFKHIGKTVLVTTDLGPKEFWYVDGTDEVNLVLKDKEGEPYTARALGIPRDGTNQTTLLNSKFSSLPSIWHNEGDITISGTVNGQGKVLQFNNGAKIIGTGTLTNVFIEASFYDQVFGSSVIVEPLNPLISVAWWGAKAEAEFGVGNGTNNLPIFEKIIDGVKVGTTIWIPNNPILTGTLGNHYYFSGPLIVDKLVNIVGQSQTGVSLYFADGSLGIKLTVNYCTLKEITLRGGYGIYSNDINHATAHGLWINSNGNTIENISAACFRGNGFLLSGSTDLGTNANNNKIKNLTAFGNGRHGFETSGADSNANRIDNLHTLANAGRGVKEGSVTGNNIYVLVQVASNGNDHPYNKSVVRHGGNYYWSKIADNIGNEPGVSDTWAPPKNLASAPTYFTDWDEDETYQEGGGVVVTNVSCKSEFSVGYFEGDQPDPENHSEGTSFIGGTAADMPLPGTLRPKGNLWEALGFAASNYDGSLTANLSTDAFYGGEAFIGFVNNVVFSGLGWSGKPDKYIRYRYLNSTNSNFGIYSHLNTDLADMIGRTATDDDGGYPLLCRMWLSVLGTTDYRSLLFAEEPPSENEWAAGDTLLYKGTDQSILGFRCIVTGEPGTWITLGRNHISITSISEASTVTIPSGTSTVFINPSGALDLLTLVLPTNQRSIEIFFGGIIAAGSNVVSALTLNASSGTTLYQVTAPTIANGGDCLHYVLNTANNKWYRKTL